jgi:hypothetical protein
MKLTATSLTALTLSAVDAGTWWNSKNYGNAIQPSSNQENQKLTYTYSTPRFYQNTLNSFRRPQTNHPSTFSPVKPIYQTANNQPLNPQYAQILNKALENDQTRSSRPTSNTMETSKVKVRVTIQQNCQYLPSIVTVQDRVNKDYVLRRLIGKKFSAVAVNRFSCNSPTELYADFVFYVYNEDLLSFDDMLNSLKPSLTRAVGIYSSSYTQQLMTIRILPEQEIIDEAVTQVSNSISKAIATTGQADASDIVDVAVNNIIEQDSVSVNNIVDDLVNVINFDREEVVNELVSKVENQIRNELLNNLTEAKEVDETIRLVSEALNEETKNNIRSPSDPELFTAISEIDQQQALDSDEDEVVASIIGTEKNEDEGDIGEFLSGLVSDNDEMLESIMGEISKYNPSIEGESSQESEEVTDEQANDLKQVLLEVTQATPLAEEVDQDYSAKDLVDAILPSFIMEEEIQVEEQEEEEEANKTSEDLLIEAKHEFKNALFDAEVVDQPTQPITEHDPVDQVEQSENPIVDEILKISESSIRETESEPEKIDNSSQESTETGSMSEEFVVEEVVENEIANSIVEASEQSVQDANNNIEEATETETLAEASSSQSSNVETDDQMIVDDSETLDSYSADDLYEVINNLVVENEQGMEINELENDYQKSEEELDGIINMSLNQTVSSNNTDNLNTNSTLNLDFNTNTNSTNTSTNTTDNLDESLDSVINDTEDSLLNGNVVEKIVNSMVVEVPEDLINSVVSARAKNSNSTVVLNSNGNDEEEGTFMNSMVETVMNMFSS